MKRTDLLPLKAVAEEMGLSRTSLWRACNSSIAGFPRPVVIRRLVYWRKAELPALEEALMRYEGRCKFEQRRESAKLVARLTKSAKLRGKRVKRASAKETDARQRELF